MNHQHGKLRLEILMFRKALSTGQHIESVLLLLLLWLLRLALDPYLPGDDHGNLSL